MVKRWAHVRKINEPKAKTPNSYTWAQMVVSYLQQSEPPLLPRVQALGGGAWTDAWSSDVDGSLPSDDLMLLVETEAAARAAPRVAELRADFDAVQAATAAAHADAAGVVLGQLLPGFFSFWLDYFDGKRQTAVVSVRHGRLLGLSEKVWANDEYDAERPSSASRTPSRSRTIWGACSRRARSRRFGASWSGRETRSPATAASGPRVGVIRRYDLGSRSKMLGRD